MTEYRFKARDNAGAEVSGMVSADEEKMAEAALRDKGLSEVVLMPIVAKSIWQTSIDFFDRVKVKDLVVFARQFAVMESASVPLVQSLRTLSRQTLNKKLRQIILEVADEVEAGSKLSFALSRHPDVFSDFYVNMIRSGETTGRLGDVLTYLADQQEKDYDLLNKVRGAMMYPAFIIVGMTGVGIVMMVFVIPKLTEVLSESGGQLPLATRVLIGVSDILSNFWWLILAAAIGAVFALRWWIKTPKGRRGWDRVKIKIPIFGYLFQRIYLVRMTRSLNTLLAGGVDLVPALVISADVVGNSFYKDLILKTKKEVEDGNSIISVFQSRNEVPSMYSQMLAVGEETGKMNEILARLGSFYSRDIDNFVANLSTIIEPIIMVVLGLAVGTMVAAIILPMYSLATQF